MLDDNIDPNMAIEMTGLVFSQKTQVDQQYLEMLQKRETKEDEELGGYSPVKTDISSQPQNKNLKGYELWLSMQGQTSTNQQSNSSAIKTKDVTTQIKQIYSKTNTGETFTQLGKIGAG